MLWISSVFLFKDMEAFHLGFHYGTKWRSEHVNYTLFSFTKLLKNKKGLFFGVEINRISQCFHLFIIKTLDLYVCESKVGLIEDHILSIYVSIVMYFNVSTMTCSIWVSSYIYTHTHIHTQCTHVRMRSNSGNVGVNVFCEGHIQYEASLLSLSSSSSIFL